MLLNLFTKFHCNVSASLCNLKPQQDGQRKSTLSMLKLQTPITLHQLKSQQLEQRNQQHQLKDLISELINLAFVSEKGLLSRRIFTTPKTQGCVLSTSNAFRYNTGLVVSVLALNPDGHAASLDLGCCAAAGLEKNGKHSRAQVLSSAFYRRYQQK